MQFKKFRWENKYILDMLHENLKLKSLEKVLASYGKIVFIIMHHSKIMLECYTVKAFVVTPKMTKNSKIFLRGVTTKAIIFF